LLPENTISGFRKAIELGADGIELDVHICKSGEIVVIHDDTVDRTTDGQGNVADLTFVELRQLQIIGDEYIATLAEVLDSIGRDIYCFIEIKYANAALPVAALVSDYIKQGYAKLFVISFEHAALQVVRQFNPEIALGASFEELPEDFAQIAVSLGAKAIIPEYKYLNAANIAAAHAAGLQIMTWTVNEPSDINNLIALGVDGIMSDNQLLRDIS
ncbi:MAG: glycerophosphodiester phosphodiesterase family protein, partial [Pseudomonadota bacterium]